MRAVLLQAMKKLECKNDQKIFRYNLEKIRTHTFYLSRIKETVAVYIIEKLSMKLQLQV